MRLMLCLLALPFLLGAGKVTYRCRDADGRWTEHACTTQRVRGGLAGDAAPADRERIERQREAYLVWCGQREPEQTEREACTLAQMDAFAFLTRRLADAESGSVEARALAGCIATHTDRDSGQVDAIAARECYAGPTPERP